MNHATMQFTPCSMQRASCITQHPHATCNDTNAATDDGNESCRCLMELSAQRVYFAAVPIDRSAWDRPGPQEAGQRPKSGQGKGMPWTEEEQRLFILGLQVSTESTTDTGRSVSIDSALQKHGKGDWRNISRDFVVTRTPTQVL
jgi:hypothetical protein